MNNHYVIIGNGPSGNRAATTLRKNDPEAGITIISDENIVFYYKPRLTDYIAGKVEEKDLKVNSLEYYKQKNIRLRLGQTVDHIDPDKKLVFLKHMEEISYTKLIIASGSRARLLPSMADYSFCLNFITSYNDVLEFKSQIQAANDFFIFGGDLVGFRFLKMLSGMGKNVTMLINSLAFWPFDLSCEMVDTIVSSLTKTGAKILVNEVISKILPAADTYVITTNSNSSIKADLIFSFNGLVPSVDFARGCGLDIDHGILVDEYMKTSADHVYACGSCAQIYNPDIKLYTTSIGWPNAVTQGEVAAMNLLGDHQVIRQAGRKYFDLEGVKIKTSWWEDIDKSFV